MLSLSKHPHLFDRNILRQAQDERALVFINLSQKLLIRLRTFLIGALLAMLAACGGKPIKVATPTAPPAVVRPQPPVVVQAPSAPPQGILTKPTPVVSEDISLWADQFLYAGWRIQKYFYDSRSRLVDVSGNIRAQGNYAQVKQAFDYLRYKEKITPKSRRLILLLHGLASGPAIWNDMRKALESDAWEARTITYPTTEQGVQPNADVVETLLKNQEGYSEIAIVAHSLGGLITRATLSRPSFTTLPVPVTTVVMLGTPNQGAVLAAMLRPIARAAVTASANDLLPERARQFGSIPASIKFAVIAGGRNSTIGYNPLLAGDNDSIVRVDETKTANMDDFIVLPVTHTQMTTDIATINAVRRFLRTGLLKGIVVKAAK
jgi:pimeloyl-ACP methyl ester carboxylesterase